MPQEPTKGTSTVEGIYGPGWRERGWPQPDANEAFIAVVRAHHFTQTRVAEMLKPFRLTVPTYGILVVLALSPTKGITMTALAKSLLLKPTRLTYLVDRLEAMGLAARGSRPSDRRHTLVRITEAGEEVRERATARVAETAFGFQGYGPEQLQAVVEALALVPSGSTQTPRS